MISFYYLQNYKRCIKFETFIFKFYFSFLVFTLICFDLHVGNICYFCCTQKLFLACVFPAIFSFSLWLIRFMRIISDIIIFVLFFLSVGVVWRVWGWIYLHAVGLFYGTPCLYCAYCESCFRKRLLGDERKKW